MAFASQIIIYYPSDHYKEQANQVREIFINRYNIPKSLMKLEQRKVCKTRDERFLELCILENYRLVKIENKTTEEIKESLLTFSKTAEVSYEY
jgi:hypothetical protein